MDLGAVRAQLADRLAAVRGLTTYSTVPAAPLVPCAVLHPGVIDPHPVFAAPGTATVGFDIQVLVQLADWATAQTALDGYVSTGTATSIVDTVEDADASITVTSIDGYGRVSIGETTYAAVTFHVQVFA